MDEHIFNQGFLCLRNFTFKIMWARGCRRAGGVASWVYRHLWDKTVHNVSLTHWQNITDSWKITQSMWENKKIQMWFLKAQNMQLAPSPHLLAAPGASAHGVTLAHGQQRGREDGPKVIEGPAPHPLCFLCDAAGLRGVFGEQLWQQGFVCVAVAAECSSHAEQAGNNVSAKVN